MTVVLNELHLGIRLESFKEYQDDRHERDGHAVGQELAPRRLPHGEREPSAGAVLEEQLEERRPAVVVTTLKMTPSRWPL